MTVRFHTEEYRRSHLREPRGRGLWMFRVDGLQGGNGQHFEHNGSFSEAKAAARNWVRQQTRQSVDVYVQP